MPTGHRRTTATQPPQPMQHTWRQYASLTTQQRSSVRFHFSMQRSLPPQWTTAVLPQQPLFGLSVRASVSSLFVAAADVSLAMEDSVRVGGLPGVSSSDSEPVPHVLDASDLQQGHELHQDCRCPCAALLPRHHPMSRQAGDYVHSSLSAGPTSLATRRQGLRCGCHIF